MDAATVRTRNGPFGVPHAAYPGYVDLTAALLTGLGLAAAAGLNAYIPLLLVAVLGYTGTITLPDPFTGLDNPWVIGVLAVLLAVEFLADKIPAVDSLNDVIGTVVRPAAGAVLFAASTGVVGDFPPAVSLILGLLTAGTVHGAKAAFRPVANVGSGGTAAPVVSITEDLASVGLSLVAIFIPALVIVALALFVWAVLRWRRRRRARIREATAV